jgi:hypothetical protein
MRLRRETGDFKLIGTLNGQVVTWNPIPKGLTAEDLVGAVAEDLVGAVTEAAESPRGYTVITDAAEDEIDGTPVIRLSSRNFGNLIYNPATGELFFSND